ncbi:putative COX4-cytochrome-c oxidase chain IV [Ceraceosorus guamensis]|uniref:Putative COX4-cytochrome-c oxidase chain IV n=1 Tax=Ceraceosorus guamensis TaxID=1522189 RepID=A0A316W6B4_9BASI|nr:putative COX4-cytochrome-c oxidase chain IV [Ceraceosorus guamensis]PWN43205.1 putative COX4-cytochrome-c oxidase chain IV [Ceraceosorus guamensis]
MSAFLRSSAPPIAVGPGAQPGEVPTDENQSTGLERFELEQRLQGKEAFDMQPLQSDRIGTISNPISVNSAFPERVIGCSGSPAGSHDTLYMRLTPERQYHRCGECGSVYTLNFTGSAHDEHH